MKKLLAISLLFPLTSAAYANNFGSVIPMEQKPAQTYYIEGSVEGLGNTEFMVDTGSGYMTLNEDTLTVLMEKGKATFSKKLEGIMADGSRKVVNVYRISSINIGGNCEIRDIEAAIFPGRTRQILGLTALKKAAPFILSFDPPQLILSGCKSSAT